MKDLEKKLAIMDFEHQEEMDRVQDSHNLELAGLPTEHRELTTKLSNNLRHLEVMGMEHTEAAKAFRDEIEKQLELRDKTHTLQLQEMAASHQARVTALETELRTKSDWGWDNEETEAGGRAHDRRGCRGRWVRHIWGPGPQHQPALARKQQREQRG